MHARTRRSHVPKPKLGAICIVSWRGREPSRTRKTSPHRRLRHTPNGSTRTFGHSSARSKRRDAAREANCTSMASCVSDLRWLSACRVTSPGHGQAPSTSIRGLLGGRRRAALSPSNRRTRQAEAFDTLSSWQLPSCSGAARDNTAFATVIAARCRRSARASIELYSRRLESASSASRTAGEPPRWPHESVCSWAIRLHEVSP
jgi:hypothetical protein